MAYTKQSLVAETHSVLSMLGENIRHFRKIRGMTQQLLCDQSTVARSTLQGIEKGSPGIAIGNYVKVLRVLGMENQLSRVGLPDSAWIKDLSDEVFRRGRFSSRN